MYPKQKMHYKIKEILRKEWDPIGIKNLPEADDEYDLYISDIQQLISTDKSVQEIFNYLWLVETEYMGLIGNEEKTHEVARKLAILEFTRE